MIARWLRALIILLSLGAAAWIGACIVNGFGVGAWFGAGMILFGHGLVFALELVAGRYVGDEVGAPRPTTRELLQAWWGEVRIAPVIFCWRQPFRADAVPDHLPRDAEGRRGVVFVHGFLCNRGFWNPWMARMRRHGIPFTAPNLEPPFGSIAAHLSTLEQSVARLKSATGLKPLVVAHSMGGLAVRHWLSQRSDDPPVHRVITIGTPHGGTWLARFSRSKSGREMDLGSDWLAQLDARSTRRIASLFTCFYSNADNVVFPAACATLQYADNRLLKGIAHVGLAFHEDVYKEARLRLQFRPNPALLPAASDEPG